MASANLDLVRSIYAASKPGAWSPGEWAHPDLEYVIADGPSPRSYTGLSGLEEGFGGFLDAWEGLRFEVDEYRELDGERVLVLHHYSGRGRTSGLELGQMQTQGAILFHVRSRWVTRLVVYWDRERAFADLGLARDTGT